MSGYHPPDVESSAADRVDLPAEQPRWRVPTPEWHVPGDEGPAATCTHCGRPFRSERARTLHVGDRHATELDDAERDDYAEAFEAETEDLFLLHLKVVFALGAVYAFFILVGIIGFSLAG